MEGSRVQYFKKKGPRVSRSFVFNKVNLLDELYADGFHPALSEWMRQMQVLADGRSLVDSFGRELYSSERGLD